MSGRITVLGSKPGTPGSGVPGPKVGYMPQVKKLSLRYCAWFLMRVLLIL